MGIETIYQEPPSDFLGISEAGLRSYRGQKAEAETKPQSKKNERANWTPARIKTLKKGVAAGKSDTEIAAELSLSASQVQRYRKNHLKIDYRKTWTPHDIKTLKRYIANGKPIAEIARLLRRTPGSIERKKEKLSLRYEPVRISKDCPKTVAQLVKFKMMGWSNERIARTFGVRTGGQITNVLRANGFSSWRLKPKGQRAGIPKISWTELELHRLRKGLTRGDSLLKLREALPRRSEHAICHQAREMTKYWRSPEEIERDRKKQWAWRNRTLEASDYIELKTSQMKTWLERLM